MKVELISFFLPQFHRVKENDEWWGEGFTEWTNVKRAKPYFEGHNQPRIPLDEKYYDLMDKATVEWQTSLMKEYGVYGLCYFHYWFHGKKMLERPAENLLKWKDIDQPFCFDWANASWARTWKASKEMATSWVDDDEASGPSIILRQEYGNRRDWEEHYNYLRDFFLDSRYIKVDNKPMFLIHCPGDIDCANLMFGLWDELAKSDGFDGIHFVTVNEAPKDHNYVDAVAMYDNYSSYDRQPIKGIKRRFEKHVLHNINTQTRLNYDTVWKNMLKRKPISGYKTYPAAFVQYDDTPRRGAGATMMLGSTPDKFEEYLKKQIYRATHIFNSEYIFVDSWNEWGEGNYLEPDETWKYGYLEATKRAYYSQD